MGLINDRPLLPASCHSHARWRSLKPDDVAGDILDRGVGGKVGEMLFSRAVGAMLAHQPHLFARHRLCAGSTDPLWRAIGDAHPQGGEACGQAPLRSSAPTDLPPLRRLEHGMGGPRSDIGHMPDPQSSTPRHRKDQFVHLPDRSSGAGECRWPSKPQTSMTGTSPEASVTDTSIWQLAFSPSAVAYWGATSTEAFQCLGDYSVGTDTGGLNHSHSIVPGGLLV